MLSVVPTLTQGFVQSIAMLSAVPTLAHGFVQIVNLKDNHWVTVSNLHCQVGTVKQYDSSGHDTTPEFLLHLISLLSFPGTSVSAEWPAVQQQKGGTDCGMSAISNCLTLCRDEEPSMARYRQKSMTKHIFSCFQAGHLAPFPSPDSSPRPGSRPPKVSTPYTTEVSVHCFCWKYVREGKEVARCRRCSKHFHVSCLSHVVKPGCQVGFHSCFTRCSLL
ncbi:hypothetical protein J4Q44_G00166870 [Coregonus suidteri]|uniref:Uncharacterized protein n=1 Tax=Coregonus suidteri TaxID=861788 RepID=A0AAN8QRA1_9TELE